MLIGDFSEQVRQVCRTALQVVLVAYKMRRSWPSRHAMLALRRKKSRPFPVTDRPHVRRWAPRQKPRARLLCGLMRTGQIRCVYAIPGLVLQQIKALAHVARL